MSRASRIRARASPKFLRSSGTSGERAWAHAPGRHERIAPDRRDRRRFCSAVESDVRMGPAGGWARSLLEPYREPKGGGGLDNTKRIAEEAGFPRGRPGSDFPTQ